jgi:hypothetical protein
MASIKDWTEYARASKIARLRGQVNISAITDDPKGEIDPDGDGVLSYDDFKRMWRVLSDGKSGEPGLISSFRNRWRLNLPRMTAAMRAVTRIGFNPCVEIALLIALRASRAALFSDGGGQFCNLTTAPLRPGDTLTEAQRKVELAAFIGTIQAGLTDFKGLRADWKRNTDRDALLGRGAAADDAIHALARKHQARVHAPEVRSEAAASILASTPALHVYFFTSALTCQTSAFDHVIFSQRRLLSSSYPWYPASPESLRRIHHLELAIYGY